MNELYQKNNWIIFLNSRGKLSSSYFLLAKSLTQHGEEMPSLLPMSFEQTRDILKNTPGKINLIVTTTNLEERAYFDKHLRRFLSFGIRSNRLKVFHLSSFEKSDLGLMGGLKGNYFFFKLPLKFSEICDKMKLYIEQEKSGDLNWPGGKRAGLPKDVGNL